MIRTCKYCLNNFQAVPSEVKRGNAKYCSRTCSAKARARALPKKEPNVTCAYCNVPFYKSPSKQAMSKSGLFFCCREHKDLAQRIGGIAAVQPAHYEDGSSVYRELAFRAYGKYCNRCGYNTAPHILQVHHKDRNRENNTLSNLEVLCPNCHEIEHYRNNDGRYT